MALDFYEIDQMVNWNCDTNPSQILCAFCPMYITTTASTCLEDFKYSRTETYYMKAEYDFTGAPSGLSRQYY